MLEKTTEKVTFVTSSDYEPQRFRERQPTGRCEAFQYDGQTFPLQFLQKGENVRTKGDGEGTLIGSVSDLHGEEWDMWELPAGHWLARWPGLGLRVHHPVNFEEGYERA
jgi:hypothetical protein